MTLARNRSRSLATAVPERLYFAETSLMKSNIVVATYNYNINVGL
jgi:hypothetical protein